MIKKCVAAFLLALVTVTAFAQQPPGVHPSYVSISLTTQPIDGEPFTSTICGGVVVHEELRLIATAWHCVPNQQSVLASGLFSVGGKSSKLFMFSPESDIALFQVTDLNGQKAPPFRTPVKGDSVVASAYYDNYPVMASNPDRFVPPITIQVTLDWSGKVVAVANANQQGGQSDKNTPTKFSQKFKWIVVANDNGKGFSGGPIFDTQGNFIGLESHGNGNFSMVTASENITSMIHSLK